MSYKWSANNGHGGLDVLSALYSSRSIGYIYYIGHYIYLYSNNICNEFLLQVYALKDGGKGFVEPGQ